MGTYAALSEEDKAQSWHQVIPGEYRTCGGCHTHLSVLESVRADLQAQMDALQAGP